MHLTQVFMKMACHLSLRRKHNECRQHRNKKRNFVTGIVTLRYAKALCILQRPSNHAVFAVLMNERSEPSIINIVFMKFINAPTACTFGSFVICRRIHIYINSHVDAHSSHTDDVWEPWRAEEVPFSGNMGNRKIVREITVAEYSTQLITQVSRNRRGGHGWQAVFVQ